MAAPTATSAPVRKAGVSRASSRSTPSRGRHRPGSVGDCFVNLGIVELSAAGVGVMAGRRVGNGKGRAKPPPPRRTRTERRPARGEVFTSDKLCAGGPAGS